MTVDRRAPRLSPDLQDRLDAFVERLTHDQEDHPRDEAERTALIDAARSLLDRLASGEPAPQPPAPGAPGSLEPGQILATGSFAANARSRSCGPSMLSIRW